MRFSKTLIPTLKEDPTEAQIVSHRLMLRAGMIRQLNAGIYTWLPLGLRVLRKVEAIVRQEMDAVDAQEVLMPAVQPEELWQESGRWERYGKELLRFVDRHDRQCCFGPTHEEVISDLVRKNIRSYKQLPANFYQIQTKFRDEIRPRFGIMRGREFLMKDAYSFDIDQEGLDASYQIMYDTYRRIFSRCGLDFRAVEADTGSIGGASSHEFHVLADSGEDVIASCTRCDYAANLEKAVSRSPETTHEEQALSPLKRVATPDQKTIHDVAHFLNISEENVVKSLLVESEKGPIILLLRGDHTLNLVKAAKALDVEQLSIPEPERVFQLTGVAAGFLGPVETKLPVLADKELEKLHDFVCGANEIGWHLTQVNWLRDLPKPTFADIKNVTVGESCSRCLEGHLDLNQGIEVGHVFKLGDKYSQSMGVRVLNKTGREQLLLMGCYGIGVSRIVAAAIEQNHDQNGILWPIQVAPFQVELLLLNPKSADIAKAGGEIYQQLTQSGVEVLLDDRDERLGLKFKDADLMGIPLRVVIGGRSFKEGVVEIQSRKQGTSETVLLEEAVKVLRSKVDDLLQGVMQ